MSSQESNGFLELNKNSDLESERCTPKSNGSLELHKNSDLESESSTPQYERNRLIFTAERISKIDEVAKKAKEMSHIQNQLEKKKSFVPPGKPKVNKVLPPSNMVFRARNEQKTYYYPKNNSSKPTVMVGELENLKKKEEEAKKIKTAENIELKKAREKEKKNKFNSLSPSFFIKEKSHVSISTAPVISPTKNVQDIQKEPKNIHSRSRSHSGSRSRSKSRSVLRVTSRSRSRSRSKSQSVSRERSHSRSRSKSRSPTIPSFSSDNGTTTPNNVKKPLMKLTPSKIVKNSPIKSNNTYNDVYNNKAEKVRPVKCYMCESVFKNKIGARMHFKRLHKSEEFDTTKVCNIKFKCYECSASSDTLGKLMIHFKMQHHSKIFDSSKVCIGKKNAKSFLQLKSGASQVHIVKKILVKPDFNATLIKRKPGFKCSQCDYSDIDKLKIILHKKIVHPIPKRKKPESN